MDDVNVKLVLRYYAAVDEGDVPELVNLFAEDVIYHRPGYPPIEGRDALRTFYADERVIATGRHEIHDVVADRHRVAAHGEFAGARKGGQLVSVRFADFFVLDRNGRFSRRDTFFFEPAV